MTEEPAEYDDDMLDDESEPSYDWAVLVVRLAGLTLIAASIVIGIDLVAEEFFDWIDVIRVASTPFAFGVVTLVGAELLDRMADR